MRIAIISDTHMPGRGKRLPAELLSGIQGVDLILHAGDWMELSVVHQLEAIAPVQGVTGNNDSPELHQRFNESLELQLGTYQVGITHGHGSSKSTLQRAIDTFKHKKLDVLIFGHSHVPYLEQHGEMWVLNPGSPTDKRRQALYSYALMDLSKELSISLHYYADKSPPLEAKPLSNQ